MSVGACRILQKLVYIWRIWHSTASKEKILHNLAYNTQPCPDDNTDLVEWNSS